MSREVWRHVTFAEAVDINPKRSLQAGTVVPYVEMSAVPAEGATIEYLLERQAGGGGAKFQNGDTLFARITPCAENGKTAFVDCLPVGAHGLGSTELIVFGPKPELTHPEYVYHLARSELVRRPAISQMVGTTGRARVPNTVFDEIAIPLPPLHEQRRIAEILSSVDEAIAATRAVIEQTRKVKQGVLERLLTKGIGHTRFKQTEIGEIPEGWELAPIEAYLARLIDYRGVPPPKSDSGVPLITAKNVRFGYLNPEPREYISEVDFADWMRRGLPQAGDVLFTTEAPLGNVAQIPDYKIALGQRTITLCPDRTRLTPAFLKWLLLSPGSQARIAENATGSTALGIKQSTFRKLKFPFPPLDEQMAIADHIEGIADAEGAETLKLESLNVLKVALMSDLLTGRKRVIDALPLAAE
ncbi:MAG: restriction endonuclease subunit S [Agrobacterium cavarae]|uniref:restriction endonuclease subunit S n=1 Tax=Agrobacterium cavarae TaxID=2528239 RepID=UPI0031B0D26D